MRTLILALAFALTGCGVRQFNARIPVEPAHSRQLTFHGPYPVSGVALTNSGVVAVGIPPVQMKH